VGRGPLFVNQRGGPLSRQWGWAITRAAADRVGLGEHFGPHVLRHSFAVHLAARGAPPGALQQLLVGQPVFLGPDELVERYRRWHPRAGPGPVPGTSASH
jgi:integrase/recombinase XerD